MLSILSEKNVDMYLRFFGTSRKSYKTEKMLFALIGALLGFIIAFFSSNIFLYSLVLILGLVGYKLPYILIRSSKSNQDMLNKYIFTEFLQSFIALIGTTGNVYATLVASREYVREPLGTELDKLIDLIEFDNKREYYLDFAKYIGTSEAHMVMDMIYKFSAYGRDDKALQKITELIDTIQHNQIDEVIHTKMVKMENVGFLPLFISLILVGGFTASLFIYYFGQIQL